MKKYFFKKKRCFQYTTRQYITPLILIGVAGVRGRLQS